MTTTNRIPFIDGFRGLAILLVMVYHLFERWHDELPYGDFTSNWFPFNIGYLGVNLFFIISGFVILLTLEKSESRVNFLWRRWLRLFPAMLIGSATIYIVALFLPERPNGPAEIKNLIPGLTFVQPLLWKVIGIEVISIENAFWSLYVEAQYYVFACIIYFSFGTRILISATIIAFLLTSIAFTLEPLLIENSLFRIIIIASNISNFHHFGWFASGCLFYLYSKNHHNHYLFYGLAMAILSATQIKDFGAVSFLSAVGLSLLFASCLIWKFPGKIISNHIFVFFGFISYPLYLIHENFLISSIVKLADYFPRLPLLFLPILPTLLVIATSYLIAFYAEPYIRTKLISFKDQI